MCRALAHDKFSIPNSILWIEWQRANFTLTRNKFNLDDEWKKSSLRTLFFHSFLFSISLLSLINNICLLAELRSRKPLAKPVNCCFGLFWSPKVQKSTHFSTQKKQPFQIQSYQNWYDNFINFGIFLTLILVDCLNLMNESIFVPAFDLQ